MTETKKKTPRQVLALHRAAERRKPHPHPAWSLMLSVAGDVIGTSLGSAFFATDLKNDKDFLSQTNPPAFFWALNGGTDIYAIDPTYSKGFVSSLLHTIGGYDVYWYECNRLLHLGLMDIGVHNKLIRIWESAVDSQVELGKDRWRLPPKDIAKVIRYGHHTIERGKIVKGSAEPSPYGTGPLDAWWYWSYLVDWGGYQTREAEPVMKARFESGETVFVL